jgi:hypothetical protein
LPIRARNVLNAKTVRWLLLVFIVWLPLQTPIAIVAFQYLHLPVAASRGVLLAKDAYIAVVLLGLLAAYLPTVRLRWYDWLALAYALTVAVYAIVPLILGTKLPIVAVAASAREFLVPVELYAVGRLAAAAGVRLIPLVLAFLITAVIAAVFTVGLYLLVPVNFWSSTLDLVSFEREVQGLANAISLWDIALLGQYGVGSTGSFARAVGPFTHPVGTATYFVVPLVLAATGTMAQVASRRRLAIALAIVSIVCAFAVITPISRAAWVAAGASVFLVGALYRRLVPTIATLTLVGIFVVLTPPFSYSVTSALSGSDSSVVGHQQAIEHGLDSAVDNPLGLGLGQGDHLGSAISTSITGDADASAAVGENLYLAMFVSIGPIGVLLFVGWLLGVAKSLLPTLKPEPSAWAQTAMFSLLIGFVIASATASLLLRFTTAATFWLLIGMSVPLLTAVTSGEPGKRPEPEHGPL